MLSRTFTVLSAFLLVCAVAAAALAPPGMTLSRGIATMTGVVEPWLRLHSPRWMQEWVEVPLLTRPMWMLPALLGVVCAGIAASATLRSASPSHRRRS